MSLGAVLCVRRLGCNGMGWNGSFRGDLKREQAWYYTVHPESVGAWEQIYTVYTTTVVVVSDVIFSCSPCSGCKVFKVAS
mgnify:CR=1 FL=1